MGRGGRDAVVEGVGRVGGVLITMAVESAVGLMEEKKERAAEIINCE